MRTLSFTLVAVSQVVDPDAYARRAGFLGMRTVAPEYVPNVSQVTLPWRCTRYSPSS